MGQFIASGVLRGVLNMNSQWAYRIPFAIQWIWPIPMIIGCIFAPESPWWYVRHGKFEEARHNLRRLTSQADPEFNVDKTVAMMQHTNELERKETAGTRYLDCFKGVNLRRTEIVCVTWIIQNICGSTFMNYSINFYEQAGLATSDSFDMTMAQYALGAIGIMASWFVMARIGRRDIYLWGLVALCSILFVIGFASIAHLSPGRDWAIGGTVLYPSAC
jgi:SP family general alpha glucoside:H+ symporter-like MFS transporter